MPEEGRRRIFQPCTERAQLLKKAASARREHDELKGNAHMVIGTDKYQEFNQIARAALRQAEIAMNEYLHHVREHRC